MPGIFISYRRVDTLAWAGHLFADLGKAFDASQVFMDINGGIPRGANFEQVLTAALAGCDSLLVLIGPQWNSCKRSDGVRRLDASTDWVRNEIAAALRRNIPVIPVLFGGAGLPSETDLPQDLHGLRKSQEAEITDKRWEYDVGELIKDLVKLPLLKQLHDVASANNGFGRLKYLIATVPAVADAVSRSKEVIETTYCEVGRLELFKTIHDSLHKIEERCLLPMQAGGPASRLPPTYQREFAKQARLIQEAMQGREVDENLRNDIIDGLESTANAFQAAMDAYGEATYARVVNELVGLISMVPAKLDVGISEAAAGLNLDHLADLMTRVRGTLPATSGEQDSELEPLIQGIDGLKGLREELEMRVYEHGLLQRLDSKLRAVCDGGIMPGNLAGEWARIKQKRSRLAPPYSPELGQAIDDLVATEQEIEKRLEMNDEEAALNYLRDYFTALSHAFQDVDTSLKEFCLRLGAVSQPLKTVLQMC
ncbi:MAG: toll/interleukin-1 receptor domain-containing protein [Blastocatellia bacterium]